MNKLVLDLYRRAHAPSTVIDPSNNMPYETTQFSADRFAELIVRECAAHLETTDYGDIIAGGNTVAEIAAVDLLELFGVDRTET